MGDLVALSGLVEAVEPERLGSTLTAAASAGDTVLQVASTEPFETESGTGRVLIAGTAHDQIGIDPDTSTITINPGLTDDMDQDVEVNVSPLSSNVVAKVSTAAGDVITARVATAHIPYLRIGDRDPDEREAVTLYREGEGYVTLDVPNGTANSDGDGLPMIPAEAVSGGGGGGGDIDGGNDDDGFVLPTLASWTPDGEPDYWITGAITGLTFGIVYTEDEVYENFDSPTFIEAEFVAGDLHYDDQAFAFDTDAEAAQIFLPAWKAPLVGQDWKCVVDGAVETGIVPGNAWNDSCQGVIAFSDFSDTPTGKYYGENDHFIYNMVDPGSGPIIGQNDWYHSSDPPGTPAASGPYTFNDPHQCALIVFIASNDSYTVPPPYPGDPRTTGITFSNVHLEKA